MNLSIQNTYELFGRGRPIPQKGKEIEWLLFGRCFKSIDIRPLEDKVYLWREWQGNKDFFMVDLNDWYKGLNILEPFYFSFTNDSECKFIEWLEQFIYTKKQYAEKMKLEALNSPK